MLPGYLAHMIAILAYLRVSEWLRDNEHLETTDIEGLGTSDTDTDYD